MKRTLFLLATLCLVLGSSLSNECQANERILSRPCPEIVLPVCAIIQSNGSVTKQTILNRCNACKNSSVQYVAPGKCENYPSQANFCNPSASQGVACYMLYQPVCGFDGSNGSGSYSNGCFACLNSSVVYYTIGQCIQQEVIDN